MVPVCGVLGFLLGVSRWRRQRVGAGELLLAVLVIILGGGWVLLAGWVMFGRVFWRSALPGFWVGYFGCAGLFVEAVWVVGSRVCASGRRVLDFAAYSGARLLSALLWLLPRRAAIRLAQFFALIAWAVLPSRRRIALRNLRIVFGDSIPLRKRRRIVRSCFLNLGRLIAEVSVLPKLVRMPGEQLFVYENLKAVEESLSEGKGLIILTGHFGCWELSALAMAKAGYRLTAVARPLDNPFLDRWTTRRREMMGCTVISRKGSARRLASHLKQGGVVAILFDQTVHRKECVFAELAGSYVATSFLPAALVRMTGARVVFGAGIPLGDGRYKLIFSDPVDPVFADGYEEFVTLNTSRYNAVFEGFLRRYPEAWLWVHNRWKDTQRRPGFWEKRGMKRRQAQGRSGVEQVARPQAG